MEDISKEPGSEEDSDEEEDDDGLDLLGLKPSLKKSKAAEEILKLFSVPESKPELDHDSDKTPELDTEAPVEHLSRAEEIAIAQARAEERRMELEFDGEELSAEHMAVVSYLEAVEATGDIDEEFSDVLGELGLPETEQSAQLRELEPDSTEDLLMRVSPASSESTGSRLLSLEPEEKIDLKKPSKSSGIVNLLLSRRKARLKSPAKAPEVKKRLSGEVDHLTKRLLHREGQIREAVRAKEKPEILSQSPAEKLMPEILRQEAAKTRPEQLKLKSPEIETQTMTRTELLTIARSIEVEGTKLSAVYENHLIGEKGLRRVVAEYIRGGNVKKALRREMIEREMDFERDPALRDQGDHTAADKPLSSLDNLLAKSGISWDDHQPKPLKKSPAKPLNIPQTLPVRKQRNFKSSDLLLTGIIMILAAILVAILLKR